MNKWIAEFELEDGDTMPEHMDMEYKGVKIDFHCRPKIQTGSTTDVPDINVGKIEPTTKNDLAHCQHTDEEIAKSFIEDVEAVKDQLPCGEQMDFPSTFDEFAKDYGFRDKKEIYTNGSELIPVFRVKQWLEHISTTKNDLAVDCVSREKVWYMITNGKYPNEDYEQFIDRLVNELSELPSVTPSIHNSSERIDKCIDKDLAVDCISRQEAIDTIRQLYLDLASQKAVIDLLKILPSVTPQYSSELEKNSKTLEKDFGELDCISRADAIRVASGYCHPSNVAKELAKLPSVTSQPIKGHWMGDSYGYICSNCEHSLNDLAQSMDYISFSKPKYCPNCGCRMVEPQETENT